MTAPVRVLRHRSAEWGFEEVARLRLVAEQRLHLASQLVVVTARLSQVFGAPLGRLAKHRVVYRFDLCKTIRRHLR